MSCGPPGGGEAGNSHLEPHPAPAPGPHGGTCQHPILRTAAPDSPGGCVTACGDSEPPGSCPASPPSTLPYGISLWMSLLSKCWGMSENEEASMGGTGGPPPGRPSTISSLTPWGRAVTRQPEPSIDPSIPDHAPPISGRLPRQSFAQRLPRKGRDHCN